MKKLITGTLLCILFLGGCSTVQYKQVTKQEEQAKIINGVYFEDIYDSSALILVLQKLKTKE